jgi:hypothetical protein
LRSGWNVNLTAPIAQEDQDSRANNNSGNPQRPVPRLLPHQNSIATMAATTIKVGRASRILAT